MHLFALAAASRKYVVLRGGARVAELVLKTTRVVTLTVRALSQLSDVFPYIPFSFLSSRSATR